MCLPFLNQGFGDFNSTFLNSIILLLNSRPLVCMSVLVIRIFMVSNILGVYFYVIYNSILQMKKKVSSRKEVKVKVKTAKVKVTRRLLVG